MAELHVVTGAFGFTGRYLAERLVRDGQRVRTLTGHPHRPNPFGDRIEVAPLDFTHHARLIENLSGARCLYNTYWVRFPRGETTYDLAVENSRNLFAAAVEARVGRLVHVSVTNPDLESPLPYFRGKAQVEQAVRESGLPHSILRPSLVFGPGDILANNIAWSLRHSPVFPIPGDGQYRVQPVFVEDVAQLAMEGAMAAENVVRDAVGPEIFAYRELVERIRAAVGSRSRVVGLPPTLVLLSSALIGLVVRDVVLTRGEIDGLMASLLVSKGTPTAPTRFSEWLASHGAGLGIHYASELARHFR
jgi:uncharacterized protein YbjT (DUF2867 family)